MVREKTCFTCKYYTLKYFKGYMAYGICSEPSRKKEKDKLFAWGYGARRNRHDYSHNCLTWEKRDEFITIMKKVIKKENKDG
jgi:hypothetical protein